jgi:membrane protein YqaA with SNARE-associated domain
MLVKILTVAGLATFEIYAAIPAGFAFGLSPLTILIATIVGGLVGVLITAFLGNKIQQFFTKKNATKAPKPKTGIGYRIWDKYGIIGLGFLGTMTIGAPASIAIGLGFKASAKKLFTWCCIGVVARCLLFTTIGYYGAQLF